MFDDRNLYENVNRQAQTSSSSAPDYAATSGVGASPDGLGQAGGGMGSMGMGAYAVPTGAPGPSQPGMGEYFQPAAAPMSGVGAYGPMAGQIDFIEPGDTSPAAALRTAGITTLAAAVFFGGGLALGGPWGGTSGVLLSGSLFNIYRAQKWWGSADPSDKHEAVVSGIFGAIGLAAGGYTAFKAYQAK